MQKLVVSQVCKLLSDVKGPLITDTFNRQSALPQEYAALLDVQLKSIPKEKREQAIASERQSLLQKWDKDLPTLLYK